MEYKQIKQIVDLMKRADLAEFELEEADFKLRLSRSLPAGTPIAQPAPLPAEAAAPPPAAAPEPVPADETKLITSPMVGTFYAAPSPDAPPFVKPGDGVDGDSIVCIVEAMKVMNEIKAEKTGTIAEVMVENGASVEYGQPLFRLR